MLRRHAVFRAARDAAALAFARTQRQPRLCAPAYSLRYFFASFSPKLSFSHAQLSSVSPPHLPLGHSTARAMHRNNRANEPTTHPMRRNRTRRQLVQRCKHKVSREDAVQGPAGSFAKLGNNDEFSVMLRLHGEAAASALTAYHTTRIRVSRMVRSFMDLERAHAGTTMVLEDSINRLRNIRSGISPTSDHARADIDRRQALLADLQQDSHKFWATKEDFLHEAHAYRKLVKHSVLDQTTLSPEIHAISASYLVLQLKTSHVLSGLRRVQRSLQYFRRNVDYSHFCREHVQSLDRLRRGIIEHGDTITAVSKYITHIAKTIQNVSLLETDVDGLAHAYVDQIMRPLYSKKRKLVQIKEWAYKRSPLVQSSTPSPGRTVVALVSIDKRTDALLIDGMDRLMDDLRDVSGHLLASTKARLEGLSTSSSLAALLRRIVVDRLLESYRLNRHAQPLHHLRLWGYKASKLPRTVHLKIRKWNVRSEAKIQQFLPRRRARIVRNDSKDRFEKVETRIRPMQDKVQASRSQRKQALGRIRTLLVSTHVSLHEKLPTKDLLQKGTSTYVRPHIQNKRQRDPYYASGLAGVPDSNKDGSSAPLLESLIPPKTSTLGKTCDLLGFGGVHDPHSKTLTGDKTQSTKSMKADTVRPSRNAESSTHRLVFKPSPQLLAPQLTSVFSEVSTSQRTSSNSIEGVNGIADADSNNTADQNADEPHHNAPKQQTSTLPNPLLKGSSDPDRPSDSEHESNSASESESESESESDMEDAEEENTHVSLSYQIPPDTLLAAKQASPNTRASYWSQQLYRGPNEETVSVHYCHKMDVAERVAKYFLEEKVVGFDMEWKPYGWPTSIKQNASLIQVACEDRIALFHIALFSGNTPAQLMPPSLRIILESPNIYKVGVNVKGDFTRLEKHLGIQARGVLELSRIHNLVERPEAGHRLCKLSTQVQQHLLLPLYKGEVLAEEVVRNVEESTTEGNVNVNDDNGTPTTRGSGSVRESDWSQALDREQIHYAAADAYAGFRLYDVLESKRKKMKPVQPLPRLCDDDPVARPSSTRRPRVTNKPKVDAAEVVNEAMGTIGDENSEDTQEYETAAEELENDDNEEPDTESAREQSHSGNDTSDADYVPRHLTSLDQASGRVPLRRIGRVKLSRSMEANPGYPTLPTSSATDEEVDSDDSDAFDPAPVDRSRKAAVEPAIAQTLSEQDEGEFADSELEEALSEMDIDKLSEVREVGRPEATMEQEDIIRELPAVDDATINTVQQEAMDLDPVYPPQPLDTTPLPTFGSLIPGPNDALGTPEFVAATLWAQSYLRDTVPAPCLRSSRPASIRATTPHLRAYCLWHHMRIPLEEIGARLKDPPLAQSTVSSYILQAIDLERLDCEEGRLRALLETVPQAMRSDRWGAVNKRFRS